MDTKQTLQDDDNNNVVVDVKRTNTGTRVVHHVKQEPELEPIVIVDDDDDDGSDLVLVGGNACPDCLGKFLVDVKNGSMSIDEVLKMTGAEVVSEEEFKRIQMEVCEGNRELGDGVNAVGENGTVDVKVAVSEFGDSREKVNRVELVGGANGLVEENRGFDVGCGNKEEKMEVMEVEESNGVIAVDPNIESEKQEAMNKDENCEGKEKVEESGKLNFNAVNKVVKLEAMEVEEPKSPSAFDGNIELEKQTIISKDANCKEEEKVEESGKADLDAGNKVVKLEMEVEESSRGPKLYQNLELERQKIVKEKEICKGSEKVGETGKLGFEYISKVVKPEKEMQGSHGDEKEVEIIKEGFGDTDELIKAKKEAFFHPRGKANTKKEVAPVYNMFNKKQNSSRVKKEDVQDLNLCSVGADTSDFPEEPGWYLVGGKVVLGTSTVKGRNKLTDNEVVNFTFPPMRSRWNPQWIVRFSTKRCGEVGRLSVDMAKIIVPLVQSGKVKVRGRCVAAPGMLSLLQDIMLYVSFYIHHSVFAEVEKSSWRLDVRYDIDSTVYPLLNLFKMLEIRPYQKAEFTPDDIDSRKRALVTDVEANEAVSALPPLKRIKGCSQLTGEDKDEQAVSESSLNKIVGAAELYDLEEMEPPSTLACDLRPYQKQALYWMTELEKGVDAEKSEESLHPCWAAYRICDERATSIYINIFSGEATTKFPAAVQRARGGILADAMGLGKTVMTIALILAKPGQGNPEVSHPEATSRVKGGTLIICPMALLGQWKDELDNHSKPDSISIFVHYGGDRTRDPRVMAYHDVVLTTYGVLTAAYKNDGEDSIYHRVDWYRVVLDEAHTIKSWKTQGARAAFTLSSHCRWCLTGTPLQNDLEDLYSLLCFLHIEPWCNWEWWNKLIQRPYNNGDPKGLKLVRAILRPLMLRRTKESKDKYGRPILVLPPTQSEIVECEQSEAEHDFYDALFQRSKVQFDQFVAQGKVLHNFANILELLLRLRQCCNHPFLVMSRGDTERYADLQKLARRFLEVNSCSASQGQRAPTSAYVEEVIEGIRQGENTVCPICMEFADDPILTPCAHKMCRECLLSSWRSPGGGLCPICRQVMQKTDLITCPSENRFRIDVEKNWKESSKVTKLLECLENIRRSGSGEKSIVFSQWTSFLDLLEIPLKRRRIGFLRFDGKLSQKQREKVLNEFSETREKRVLLMSLKAGGVGLNLTAASNVFLMDPWWNPAVEEQAIMRIHRIGQKRTVCIKRFIVKGTVEDRMQHVQAKKQRMIAGALTNDDVRSARIEELKMLFR